MIVAMDDANEATLLGLKAWLDSATFNWLCLYTNNITLAPNQGNPLLFIEASYGGYTRQGLFGSWSAPVQDTPGRWAIQSGPWTFPLNTGATFGPVYGWFLLRDSRVVYAEAFDGPLTVTTGRLGPTLIPRLTQGSQSVVCSDS